MKQDMIVILDLGSTANTVIAREIRDLGVYSEIHPHDITVEELKALDNVKGIVLNGGENRVVDGAEVEIRPELYALGYPMFSVDYPSSKCEKQYRELPDQETLKKFLFEECKAEPNWNMKNFVEDQIELIRRQVGDRKVLLAGNYYGCHCQVQKIWFRSKCCALSGNDCTHNRRTGRN